MTFRGQYLWRIKTIYRSGFVNAVELKKLSKSSVNKLIDEVRGFQGRAFSLELVNEYEIIDSVGMFRLDDDFSEQQMKAAEERIGGWLANKELLIEELKEKSNQSPNKEVALGEIKKLSKSGELFVMSGWDSAIDEKINTNTFKRKILLDDTTTLQVTKKHLVEIDFNHFDKHVEIDFRYITPSEYMNEYGEEYTFK